MSQSVAELRIRYEKDRLMRGQLAADPFDQFRSWLDEAIAANILEPNAMTLATSTPDGVPSARMVLLKGIDHGFCFYTHYESQKGSELAANPHAALVFYWDTLHRQVRICGQVGRVSAEQSADYYHSRPRGSQIGAWASPQSRVLSNRDVLEARQQEMLTRFADDDDIPLPPFWGGFRLIPRTIEFWQGQRSRLHDRFCYTRSEIASNVWQIERLAP